MARKSVRDAQQSASLWPLETDQIEVEAYMARLLATRVPTESPVEPDWVREALDESWPRVLAAVDAAAA